MREPIDPMDPDDLLDQLLGVVPEPGHRPRWTWLLVGLVLLWLWGRPNE